MDIRDDGCGSYRVVRARQSTPRTAVGAYRPVPPPDVRFDELLASEEEDQALRIWAISLARCLVWRGVEARHSALSVEANVFHECWVDQGTALFLRYAHYRRKVGARFDGLDIDTTSGLPLSRLSGTDAARALRQANDLYEGGLNGAPPAVVEWEDSLGYGWFGDRPTEGWEVAVEHGTRLATVYSVEA